MEVQLKELVVNYLVKPDKVKMMKRQINYLVKPDEQRII
jgi:hypothetical protein